MLAACSPAGAGWCGKADYTPAAGQCPGEHVKLAPAQITAALPDGVDSTAVKNMISDVFSADLAYCGNDSETDGGLVLYTDLSELKGYKDADGIYRLLSVGLKVKAERGEKVSSEKTYSRSWAEQSAPDRDTGVKKELPSFMLEIRDDIAAMRR